jgi:hypothetical protein
MKVRIDFKNRNLTPPEWSLNKLLPNFNAHADDKKAVRKAAMKEIEPTYRAFVQHITLVKE